jgi:hypothetical protein
LTPLDYCSGENADLAELLRSFGGLSGEDQRAAAEREADKEVEDTAEEQKEDGKSGKFL